MIPKTGCRFSHKIMRKNDIKFVGLKPGITIKPTVYADIGIAAFSIARGESSRYKVAGARGATVGTRGR
jgi:hypothetical protein